MLRCVCRPGVDENAFHNPVHLVTYFRYLRFFRDGRCIKYLCTDEPSAVVKSVVWSPHSSTHSASHHRGPIHPHKGFMQGFYEISPAGDVHIIVKDAHRPCETFFMHLALR